MIQFYFTFIYILLYLDAETAFNTVYIISDYYFSSDYPWYKHVCQQTYHTYKQCST